MKTLTTLKPQVPYESLNSIFSFEFVSRVKRLTLGFILISATLLYALQLSWIKT